MKESKYIVLLSLFTLFLMALLYVTGWMSLHNSRCVDDIYRRLEVDKPPIWRSDDSKIRATGYYEIYQSAKKSKKKRKSYKK